MSGVVRALGRLILAIVGVVVALGLVGIIWFQLFPPFGQSEPGYVSTTSRQDVLLPAGDSVSTYRFAARFDERIFEGTNEFPSANFRARLLSDPYRAGVALHVYPDDGVPLLGLLRPDDRSHAAWDRPCDPRARAGVAACHPRYLVVITGTDLPAETPVSLELFVEQEFPAPVETPWFVSIGLDVEGVPQDAGRSLVEDIAIGRVPLSPSRPVGRTTLSIDPEGDGSALGSVLEVTVTREGDAIPVGLGAQPPVRLAIVTPGDRVIDTIGVRPGTDVVDVLPPIAGDLDVIAWWGDLADQAYELEWRLSAAAISAVGPLVESGRLERPDPIRDESVSGEQTIVFGRETTPIELSATPDVPVFVEPGRLPAEIGTLELRLELSDGAGDRPRLLRLSPEFWSHLAVPLVLDPGATTTTTLTAFPTCASRCGPWLATFGADDPDQRPGTGSATISWSARLRTWPLGVEWETGP